MLLLRSISKVQLCLLLISLPSCFAQYYNPDYSVTDDLEGADHAGYRGSSANDNSGEQQADDRPDYSQYYKKNTDSLAPLTAGNFDADSAKQTDEGFVSPLDFSGFLSAGQFGAASNQEQSNPVIPIQNPFHFQDALKKQNSSGFVDATEFAANFANAPSFDFDIGKHFANNPFEQKTENTYEAPKKDYKKQSYKSEVDDLNSYDKGTKNNYEKPKIDYKSNDYKYNPVLPTLSSYTGGKINHLAPVKTYVPQLFPANKHTNAPLNIQSTLAPYNFQPTINLPQLESIKSTLPPLNSYNLPATSGYDFTPTEFAQPSEYKSQKVQNNCQQIEKQLSPDDITHGRFRRQADKMNCYLCKDPKTGGSYEQCSYTSSPENDQSYFRGHAEKYRTKTYTDPDEDHSRRRRETANKKNRKNKQKRQDKDESDHYSNPYDYEKNSAHKFNSKPHEFDDSESYYQAPDFSHYEKDSENYQFGPEYFQDAATEEKSYSELQSEELKKNGQNCKKVKKDAMTCMICANPKTGGNYEQCSYSSEPNEKKFAYVKEKKYNSNDPEEKVVEGTETKPNTERFTAPKLEFASPSVKHPKKLSDETHDYDYIPHHYISETKQKKRFEKAEEPAEKKDYLYKLFPEYAEKETKNSEVKERPSFEYKSELPEYFAAEESKKDVDSVLQEFTKKDRSKCKKIAKDKMTCYICLDDKGVQHEECMFVSESAPKSSHIAYHEVKEFSSDPKKEKEEVTADSKPTPNVQPLRELKKRQNSKVTLKEVDAEPTEYVRVVGKTPRIVRRKTNLSKGLLGEESRRQEVAVPRPKRQEKAEAEAEPAPPKSPEAAYASELLPVFSKQLGVTLPKYMLDISEGEKIFDEVVKQG